MVEQTALADLRMRDRVAVLTGAGARWLSTPAVVVAMTAEEVHLALFGAGPEEARRLVPGALARLRRGREASMRVQVVAYEVDESTIAIVRPLPGSEQEAANNRRAFHRAPILLEDVTLTARHAGQARGTRARVVDLSGGGARLTVPVELHAGDLVLVRLRLPDASTPLDAPGKVVWARRLRRSWLVGIRFDELPAVSRDRLVRTAFRAELDLRRPA